MKKNIKLILALVLSIMMVLGSMSALADSDPTAGTAPAYGTSNTHEITISNPDQKVSHTYEGYQIFVGNLNAAEGKLSDVIWGTGVDGTALISALVTANTTTGNPLYGKFPTLNTNSTAADLATALDDWDSTDGLNASAGDVDAFAKVVAEHLVAAGKFDFTENPSKTYKANVTGDGYYFIKDVTTSLTNDTTKESDTLSRYLLRVIKDQTIIAKDSGTKSDKVIVEGNTESNDNDAAIGDTITYKTTLNPIPDPTKYNKFWLVMEDTMDAGLTFTGITGITIDGTTVETSKYDVYVKYGDGTYGTANSYTAPTDAVKTTPGAKTTFKIVFKDAKGLIRGNAAEGAAAQYAGKALVVNYTAVLNKDAVLAPKSNDNKEHFIFSNNPNYDYDGDDVTDDSVVGTTPEKTVETYTTAIQIVKVDGSNNNAPLEGAIFKITAENVFNVSKVTGEKFVQGNVTIYKNTAGDIILSETEYNALTADEKTAFTSQSITATHWELKDGSFTDTDPDNVTNQTQYVNPQVKWSKVPYANVVMTPDTEASGKSYTLVSGADGVIKLAGLKAGVYTVTELNAPDGYNKIEGTETLTIDWNGIHTGWTSPEQTAKNTANGGFTLTSSTGMEGIQFELTGNQDSNTVVFSATVQNNSGVELPSTGGIGTTIFYIAGSILVLAAAILLITKRRMGAND